MRTITPGMAAHLQLPTTTLAMCWLVERQDGAIYAYTTHDTDLVIDGQVYAARTAYSPSQVDATASLAVDNLEVVGVLDDDSLTAEDLTAGLWDYATVRIFLVNWANLALGKIRLTRGSLGEVSLSRSSFNAELRGLKQHLQQVIGRIYAAQCDADLGDARCKVDLPALTVSGTVTATTSRLGFTDSSRGEADDYFTGGKVTFTGGANDGLSMEVKEFDAGGAVRLQLPMPYVITVGDTYTMSPGCEKRRQEDCHYKFANVINFRGFPDVPTMDQLVAGPTQ